MELLAQLAMEVETGVNGSPVAPTVVPLIEPLVGPITVAEAQLSLLGVVAHCTFSVYVPVLVLNPPTTIQ